MLALKEQAFEIIRELPQEKIPTVIAVLRGLQMLSQQEHITKSENRSAMGIFNKYANPELVSLEKDAWKNAMVGKHGFN
ncbi:MAG: hypothetical protein FWC77_07565 [Defluviitaleaceae bacterium]|nr:hypothetical protein [Defluviitaleaceae bacterium]